MRPNYLTNPFLYSSTNFFNACLSEANNLKLIFQFSCKTSSNLRKLFKQLVVNILVVSCVLALDFSLKYSSHYLFCSMICLRTNIIIHISSLFSIPPQSFHTIHHFLPSVRESIFHSAFFRKFQKSYRNFPSSFSPAHCRCYLFCF